MKLNFSHVVQEHFEDNLPSWASGAIHGNLDRVFGVLFIMRQSVLAILRWYLGMLGVVTRRLSAPVVDDRQPPC